MNTDEVITQLLRKFEKVEDKIDDMGNTIHDVDVRLARVEEKQDSHYGLNEKAHTDLAANVVEVKTDVEELTNGHNTQQTVLDTQKGANKVKEKVKNRFWELLIALIAGGVLLKLSQSFLGS